MAAFSLGKVVEKREEEADAVEGEEEVEGTVFVGVVVVLVDPVAGAVDAGVVVVFVAFGEVVVVGIVVVVVVAVEAACDEVAAVSTEGSTLI